MHLDWRVLLEVNHMLLSIIYLVVILYDILLLFLFLFNLSWLIFWSWLFQKCISFILFIWFRHLYLGIILNLQSNFRLSEYLLSIIIILIFIVIVQLRDCQSKVNYLSTSKRHRQYAMLLAVSHPLYLILKRKFHLLFHSPNVRKIIFLLAAFVREQWGSLTEAPRCKRVSSVEGIEHYCFSLEHVRILN